VCVTENDGVGFLTPEQLSHLGAGRTGIEYVAKYEPEAAEFEDLNLPSAKITVAVSLNSGDRRYLLESVQHGIGADVAGVQDVVDTGEELRHLLVEGAVGVRDDADLRRDAIWR
jgi:hypothetical protein